MWPRSACGRSPTELAGSGSFRPTHWTVPLRRCPSLTTPFRSSATLPTRPLLPLVALRRKTSTSLRPRSGRRSELRLAPPTSVPVPTRRPSLWLWRGTPARYSLSSLNVRDPWVYPMAVPFVGLLLSFAVTYMATTGSALLILLRGIDTLRQRLVRPWLLPTDDVADWERRLSMLNAQAGQTPQPQAKSTLDAIGNEIDQARIESEVRLKTSATDRATSTRSA